MEFVKSVPIDISIAIQQVQTIFGGIQDHLGFGLGRQVDLRLCYRRECQPGFKRR